MLYCVLCVCASFGYIAESGSAGSFGVPVFNFSGFQSSFVDLYSWQQCERLTLVLLFK